MTRLIAALALLASLLSGGPARAGTDAELRALYARFYAAQNARDVDAVRATLLDSERFLWVSNGQSFRGRETMLARMAEFQKAEIWEVTPELDRAEVVELGADAAYLHLPLALAFGARRPGPERYRFLVTVLCVRTDAGWRIAALLTTRDGAD
jgi:uncharacterized protein (TIGR02246 family)